MAPADVMALPHPVRLAVFAAGARTAWPVLAYLATSGNAASLVTTDRPLASSIQRPVGIGAARGTVKPALSEWKRNTCSWSSTGTRTVRIPVLTESEVAQIVLHGLERVRRRNAGIAAPAG